MTESELIYSEEHRTTFLSHFMWYLGLLLLVAAVRLPCLWIRFLGEPVFRRGGIAWLLGCCLAGGHWLMAPRRYEVYEGGLAVVYGRPRVRLVRYPEISNIEVISHPLGTEIRIHLTQGGVLGLHPLHPRQFHENLESGGSGIEDLGQSDVNPALTFG